MVKAVSTGPRPNEGTASQGKRQENCGKSQRLGQKTGGTVSKTAMPVCWVLTEMQVEGEVALCRK